MKKEEIISQQILEIADGLNTETLNDLVSQINELCLKKTELVKDRIETVELQQILALKSKFEACGDHFQFNFELKIPLVISVHKNTTGNNIDFNYSLPHGDHYSRYYLADLIDKKQILANPEVVTMLDKFQAFYKEYEAFIDGLSQKYKLHKSLVDEIVKNIWDEE